MEGLEMVGRVREGSDDLLGLIAESLTEEEISDVIDLAPDDFQQKMWSFWDAIPNGTSFIEFSSITLKEVKRIIWQTANDENNQLLGFDYWLQGIPLLPKDIIDPLCDNYHDRWMAYVDDSDSYEGFDRKPLCDDALKKIQAWLNRF